MHTRNNQSTGQISAFLATVIQNNLLDVPMFLQQISNRYLNCCLDFKAKMNEDILISLLLLCFQAVPFNKTWHVQFTLHRIIYT